VKTVRKKAPLTLKRVLNAPLSAVLEAWTDERLVKRWWGPRGFTNPVCIVDARPGGEIHIDMRGPDGVVYPMAGAFREITPKRIVLSTSALNGGEPFLETLNTVDLAERGGKTELTMRATVVRAKPEAEQALAGMEEGWSQSLDKLAEFLAET
jgi:uncharacterized protein YndB with AHSA1/START domain